MLCARKETVLVWSCNADENSCGRRQPRKTWGKVLKTDRKTMICTKANDKELRYVAHYGSQEDLPTKQN